MVAKSFEVDDLVWAKMKGYSPWPGKIMVPPADAKSKPKKYHHYVFFFGSNNHAWIPDESIELHSETLVKKFGNKKPGLYQTAVETIVELSKGISKYQKSNESLTEPKAMDTSSTAAEQENSFSKLVNSSEKKPKIKMSQSNSVPKKFRKKLPMKKHSSIRKLSFIKKPIRKRTHSSDQSESESYPASFQLESIYARSNESLFSSPKDFRLDEGYAQLMSNIPPNLSYTTDVVSTSVTPVSGVLQRRYYDRPDTPPIDLTYESEVLKKKKIKPISKKIGFLGLGKMSQGIVKNLYHSGHSIIIWNQTPTECEDFAAKFDIQIAATPADVVEAADITFSCVSDAETAKQLVFGNCGILKEIERRDGESKGYVEMTSMDPKVSEAIGKEIKMKGGRYLEAPLSGSRIDANEGTLLILAAGDETLYDECKSCLDAVSKRHKYVGSDIGTASKLSLIQNMLIGTVYAAVAESLALVSRVGLKGDDFLDSIKDFITSDNILDKGKSMINNQYVSNTSLKQTQQHLNLGLLLGDKIAQPTPIFAAVNEVYKHCKSMRYGDHDVSAVYEGTKP